MSAIAIRYPLNALDGPIYPDIKKDILRFQNSRRYWKVDAGIAVKETEKYPFFVESAIEFQSRDRNETMYGKSGHRTYVNEQVIYPLVSPWDLEPLSHKPRSRVTPRMNPESPYPQNERLFNGINGFMQDKIATHR